MKTLIKPAPSLLLLATCLGLGFTTPALAQSAGRPQPVNVDQVSDFTYLLRVSNPALERSEVKVVRLSNNAVLFHNASYAHTLGHKLNVRELPDGEYAFVVKVGKKTHRYTLDIHTQMQRSARLGSVSMPSMAVR
ncbi:hypothetical protein [Hymenobacter koreensis]